MTFYHKLALLQVLQVFITSLPIDIYIGNIFVYNCVCVCVCVCVRACTYIYIQLKSKDYIQLAESAKCKMLIILQK